VHNHIVGSCKVIPVLNLALRHDDVGGIIGIAPPFSTSALGGGVCGQLHVSATLPSGEASPLPIG
jgi:hypothetical protein